MGGRVLVYNIQSLPLDRSDISGHSTPIPDPTRVLFATVLQTLHAVDAFCGQAAISRAFSRATKSMNLIYMPFRVVLSFLNLYDAHCVLVNMGQSRSCTHDDMCLLVSLAIQKRTPCCPDQVLRGCKRRGPSDSCLEATRSKMCSS